MTRGLVSDIQCVITRPTCPPEGRATHSRLHLPPQDPYNGSILCPSLVNHMKSNRSYSRSVRGHAARQRQCGAVMGDRVSCRPFLPSWVYARTGGWWWGEEPRAVGGGENVHASQLTWSELSKELLLVLWGDTGLGGLLRLELFEAVECLGESESSRS